MKLWNWLSGNASHRASTSRGGQTKETVMNSGGKNRQGFDSLVDELVQIGESTVMEGGRSHFFLPEGEGIGPHKFWHPHS